MLNISPKAYLPSYVWQNYLWDFIGCYGNFIVKARQSLLNTWHPSSLNGISSMSDICNSDNCFSPVKNQVLTLTNADLSSVWTPITNCSEICMKIHGLSVKKENLKILFAKWQPFHPGLSTQVDIVSSFGKCHWCCCCYLILGEHFTKCLWAHNSNLIKLHIVLASKMIIWSGHNFPQVMTAGWIIGTAIRSK